MTDPTKVTNARPSSADRAAAIQAARASLEAPQPAAASPTQPPVAASLSHTSAAATSPQTTSDSGHRPPRRKPAGRASRLAMAGGAIGVSFGLVGAMAAASQEAQAAAPNPVVQRVVVPANTAVAPSQIIVMLPQSVDTPVTTIEVPASGAVTIPAQAAAPAPVVSVAAPVTESSGS